MCAIARFFPMDIETVEKLEEVINKTDLCLLGGNGKKKVYDYEYDILNFKYRVRAKNHCLDFLYEVKNDFSEVKLVLYNGLKEV